MTELSPDLLNAVLREDLASFIAKGFETLNPGKDFVPSWYIDHLAYEFRECAAGNRTRLIISMPPRYGKSTIASVLFPAWCLGHDPSLRIVCISYAQELAFKLSADFRKIVESEWYCKLFPEFQINPDKCSEREIQTLGNGGRFASSVGGVMTGLGGDMLILDDVIKASDVFSEVARQNVVDWLQNTAFSRLDNKATGTIIVVGQRLHLPDPIGQLLASGAWHAVTLPAIAEQTQTFKLAGYLGDTEHVRKVGDVLDPTREPSEVLDQIRLDMGAANFNAQYQQRPEFQDDSYIVWDWLKRYENSPPFDFVFLSVDPAIATTSTSDWSVCMVFGVLGVQNYVLHIERKRLGFDLLALRLDQIADHYRADAILVERSGIGISLIEHLWKQDKHRIEYTSPKGSKVDRLIAVLPQIELGHVLVPKFAPWLDALRSELQAFPNGIHDDQVNSRSHFLKNRANLIMRSASGRRHRPNAPLRCDYGQLQMTVKLFG